MEMGVDKTLPNTNRKIVSKKNKEKKSLWPILFKFYYPLQQEMLIYKDCIAELLVPHCGHTTPALNSCLPWLKVS